MDPFTEGHRVLGSHEASKTKASADRAILTRFFCITSM
jgi:hypothetical protein